MDQGADESLLMSLMFQENKRQQGEFPSVDQSKVPRSSMLAAVK